jgi:hypothetical protein
MWCAALLCIVWLGHGVSLSIEPEPNFTSANFTGYSEWNRNKGAKMPAQRAAVRRRYYIGIGLNHLILWLDFKAAVLRAHHALRVFVTAAVEKRATIVRARWR